MRVLNFGSLNIDKVYGVEHFVSAAETILATKYERFLGGKGLNQSIALARGGANVFHAGAIGADGEGLREFLRDNGVDTRYLRTVEGPSGHAVIQVNPAGENCIIVASGANGEILPEDIDRVLDNFGAGDLLLLQNEISNVAHAIRAAKARGMEVAFNASPITENLLHYPIELTDYLIVNEIEGAALLGAKAGSELELLRGLCAKYADSTIILTVGENGAYYGRGELVLHQDIFPAKVVDTTAAGDTFCGYFIAALLRGRTPEEALRVASLANSLTISRKGAAPSIPSAEEVAAFARTQEVSPALVR